LVPLKIVSNVSRFKPALNLNRVLADFGGFKPRPLNLNRVLADFGGFKPRLKFFKFHLRLMENFNSSPPVPDQNQAAR